MRWSSAAELGPGEHGAGELPPEPDEQRLEGEARRELELLGLAPGIPDDRTGLLGGEKARHTLGEMKEWMTEHNHAVMAVLFLVFGVVLIAKGIGLLA